VTEEADQTTIAATQIAGHRARRSRLSQPATQANGCHNANAGRTECVLFGVAELQRRRVQRAAERARRIALAGSVLNDPDVVGRESGGR
jgi:hypothetical protein